MAEMDLKDKEKMLFPFRTRAMRSTLRKVPGKTALFTR